MAAQVETAREARLQGPGLFALERLLYVFWGLLRCSCDDTDDEPFSPTDELSAGIFTQISSLVSLQLLTQVSVWSFHLHDVGPLCMGFMCRF